MITRINEENNIVKLLLKRWGVWYYNENKSINLGYPSQSSFLNLPNEKGVKKDSSAYVAEYDDRDELSPIIHNVLLKNPVYLKVAEISYSSCRDCSNPVKSVLMKKANYYLGSSEDTCRKKYSELEGKLHAYIEGFVACNEIN